MIEIVERAAEKVGGLGKLAEGLGIRHQSFYSWKEVPSGRVIALERLTGIPREEIRPDLYASQGDDAGPAAAAPLAAAGPACAEAAP